MILATASNSCGPMSGLHSTVQLSLPAAMASKAPLHAVDRHDQDVLAGLEPGLLDGLDGAERHVVVVGVQRRDLLRVRAPSGRPP
jgi:hypothetical protein